MKTCKTLALTAFFPILFAGLFAGAVYAVDTTSTFVVRVNILPTCRVATTTTADATGASDINFGDKEADATALEAANAAAADATPGIKVTCSKTTPYVVKLTPSNNDSAGAGKLGHASAADKIDYQLRQATGASAAVWGNTGSLGAVGNSVAGTGNGAAQGFQVHATIAGVNNVTPGEYKDTVTVMVSY